MPSTSKKQHNLMEAVAHSPAFAKKVGIKQSVGQDFATADKGKKFKGGGMALFKGKETYGEELKEAKSLKNFNLKSLSVMAMLLTEHLSADTHESIGAMHLPLWKNLRQLSTILVK